MASPPALLSAEGTASPAEATESSHVVTSPTFLLVVAAACTLAVLLRRRFEGSRGAEIVVAESHGDYQYMSAASLTTN